MNMDDSSTLWFWRSCFLVAELWWNIFLLDALIFRMNLPNLLICLKSHRQKHCPWLWFTMSPPSLNRLAYLCPPYQAPMFSPLTLESKQLCFSLCPRFSYLTMIIAIVSLTESFTVPLFHYLSSNFVSNSVQAPLPQPLFSPVRQTLTLLFLQETHCFLRVIC